MSVRFLRGRMGSQGLSPQILPTGSRPPDIGDDLDLCRSGWQECSKRLEQPIQSWRSQPLPFTTLTLHPATDRILDIARLEAGGVLDSRLRLEVPAGKGVNTARSLSCIVGGKSIIQAAVWLGENEKAKWKKELTAKKIRLAACLRPVPTRLCLTVLEKGTGRETHLRDEMPRPTVKEEQALLKFSRTLALRLRNHHVAVCGSAPPGTRLSTLKTILEILKQKSAHVIADTNGLFLRAAFRSGLTCVKGNAVEIADLLKCKGPFDPNVAAHRRKLHQATARATPTKPPGESTLPGMILVTLGSGGAVLSHANGLWMCRPPEFDSSRIKSTTGCGDAATAGLLWGISRSIVPKELLKEAVAFGTAKLLFEDPGKIDRALVYRLLKGTRTHLLQA